MDSSNSESGSGPHSPDLSDTSNDTDSGSTNQSDSASDSLLLSDTCDDEGASSSEGTSSSSDGAWNVEASSAWTQSLGTLYVSKRPLRLLLPCAGFDAPGFALKALKIPFEVVGAWDVACGPAKVLQSLYHRSVVHTGEQAGDITKVNPRDLPDAEGIVSGTPCPPWSSAGKGLAWEDERSSPFLKLIGWVSEMACKRKCLQLFILENVKGVKCKRKGTQRTPLRHMLRLLRKSVPAEWVISVTEVGSECLAQHRPRVYIVGHTAVNPPERKVEDFMTKMPSQRLEDILLLHKVPNQDPEQVLTKKQLANLRVYSKQVNKIMSRGKKRAIATFEVARDPYKPRAGIDTDHIRCLRASAPKLWIMSHLRSIPGSRERSGLGLWQSGRISRLLHAAEYCLLQGFSPSMMPRNLSDREVKKGMGNAMSVPVVGMILNAALLTLQSRKGSGAKRKLAHNVSSASSCFSTSSTSSADETSASSSSSS